MTDKKGVFRHEYTHGSDGATASVIIAPINLAYMAARLKLSPSETEEVLAHRSANQAAIMPNLVGEFAIAACNTRSHGIAQMAQIEALEAHAEHLGIGQQVYAVHRTDNILHHGTLFGPFSNPSHLEVRDENKFYAAQTADWRDQLGWSHNNPFSHLTREVNAGFRIMVSYGLDMIEPFDDRVQSGGAPMHDTAYWRPKDGRTIEESVQVLYQPLV